MSTSTHIIAFRDMDGEFARMLEVKQFCDMRKVSYPQEVKAYFRGMAEESEENLREEFLTVNIDSALTEWRSDEAEGHEIEIAKLPPEVKTIRFYQSW